MASVLPTTKEVLCEHVYAVVKALTPQHVDKVTGMLCELTERQLFDLLQDKAKMAARVQQALTAMGRDLEMDISMEMQQGMEASHSSSDLGDELFQKVSEIETELCAQITGMLLEMDRATLQSLMHDQYKLEGAVNRAKLEYLREHHPTTLPSREDLGEELYDLINKQHPHHAKKITGMLLDLDVTVIQDLLESPTQLDSHIEQALTVIEKS